jgi:hypothetical protein
MHPQASGSRVGIWPMRRAVLHIGTEKTGSTSIQAFLAGNIPRLAGHGIACLPFGGLPASQRLVLAALEAGAHDHLARDLGLPAAELGPGRRARFRAGFGAEVARLPAGIRTVVFSSEHLHSRLVDRPSVRRLHDLVAPHFDALTVLVYLRRQDRLAVSRYTTAVLHGACDDVVFPAAGEGDPFYDFERALALWAGVFGPSSLRPRLYAERHAGGPDIVGDFAGQLGLGDLHGFAMPGPRNSSLRPAALDAFVRLNRSLARQDAPARDQLRGIARRLAREGFAGEGRLPGKAEAAAFSDRFAASNERVRRRWFADRAALFDEDFSRYPDNPMPQADADSVAEASVALLIRSLEEVRRLEEKVAYSKGRIKQLRLRPTRARHFYERASMLDPDLLPIRPPLARVANVLAAWADALRRIPQALRRDRTRQAPSAIDDNHQTSARDPTQPTRSNPSRALKPS